MSLSGGIGLAPQLSRINSVVSCPDNGLRQLKNPLDEYFEIMAQPVNNFLKDFTQMEKEFRRELEGDERFLRPGAGKIIPIDEALKGCGEENY